MTAAVPPARSPRSAGSTPAADLSVTVSLPAAQARQDLPAAQARQDLPAAQARQDLPAAQARQDLPAPEHLVPNVLIAGVTHAGATGLAEALGRHPQIKRPAAKRIDHYTPMRFGRPVEAAIADYDRHFSTWSGQRYRLENSAVYFDGGKALVDAVRRELPEVRVLILLRDPADRLWTSFRDKVDRGRLPHTMTYETFVDRCLALRANGADRFEGNRYFRTLSSGLYVEHLSRWLDSFGRRAKVVFAEDFEADADQNVATLFEWLDLDPTAARSAQRDDVQPDGELLVGFEPGGRRRWPVLPRPGGSAWRPTEAGVDLVRRVARPRVPRQSDRVRNRVETLYSGANRELAAVLRDHGYSRLPGWLG